MEEAENDFSFFEKLDFFKNFSTDPYMADLKHRPNSIFNVAEQGKEGYVYSANKIRYDAPGNILFGYAGRALGLSNFILHAGAGYYQSTTPNYNANWIFVPGTYGDDPSDAAHIRIGSKIYDAINK